MAPLGFALLAAGLLASSPAAVQADANADYPPLPGLKRILVLARHGNRAPNPPIGVLCPNFAKHVLPGFEVAPAALSRVGMAENEENGVFIRNRYKDFLPDGPFNYDGTWTFFAERMSRNVVSTQCFARGIFPPGTGLEGFAKEKPNLVPISTTQDGADIVINCPGNGPCVNALKADIAKWVLENGDSLYNQHKALMQNVSKACGYDMVPGQIVVEGKNRSITWAAKIVMDAFTFGLNEGLDATMGGRISLETISEFKNKIEDIVHQQNFGKPHQLTYWAGDFIPTMLQLARFPLPDEVNKFHLFLNHRELMYAVAKLWKIPIQFPGSEPDSIPSGASLIMEVYEEGLRLFFWMPSRPSAEDKAKHFKEDKPINKLYPGGTLIPVEPQGCVLGHLCPLDVLALHFVQHVRKTGTYVDICNVSKEDTYLAQGEASLGIMEQWLAVGAVGFPAPEQELSAVARQRQDKASEQAISLGSHAAAVATMALAFVTGYIGFALGRRSVKDKSLDELPYMSLS